MGMPNKPVHPSKSGGFVGIEMGQLVLQQGATLPNSCVKTGDPASHWVKRKFYWHHPAIYLAILGGLLIYVILVLVLRKTMVVQVPLSEEVFRKRRRRMFVCGSVMLICVLGIGLSIFGIATLPPGAHKYAAPSLFFLALGSFLTLLVTAIVQSKVLSILTPKKMTDVHGWFSGCHSNFLRQIEERSQ